MKYKYLATGNAKNYLRSLSGLLAPLIWAQLEHIRGNASIVCYHRVAPAEAGQPSNLIVPPTVFEKHLRFLSARFNVVSMDRIVEDIEGKSQLKNSVAITFDDGYADFKIFALPILRKLNVPATVYLCTDFLDGKGLFWWHLLDAIVACNNELRFSWQEKEYRFSPEAPRKDVYKKISQLFLNGDPTSQSRLAERLIKSSRVKSMPHDTARMMRWDDIKDFEADPLISIGAHTTSHCALSKQPQDDVLREMTTSKSELENFLGHPVRHFAYPFGTTNEAGDREYRLAKTAGYSSGVTLVKGHLHYKTVNRFAIPRFHIPGNYFSVNQLKAMLSGLEVKITQLVNPDSRQKDSSGEE